MDVRDYFMPYQVRWLQDQGRRKIWEKSRRIGATYVQAYEDVRDCVAKPGLPVWFSSADESAAKEWILYCEQWAKIFKTAGAILKIGEEVLDEKNDIRALVIRLKNGSRLMGLASNPKAFRSKGGKVVLDEFDWHKDQRRMFAAAKPCVTWGFDLRLMSTYQSKTGLYAQMIRDARKALEQGKAPPISLHSTDIFQAVNEGLVDKIFGRPTTAAERQAWLEEERAGCFDENIWQQEYCCIPMDEADAFLAYSLIYTCEDPQAGKPELAGGGPFYVGMDIGRRRDLTIIWVDEEVGDVLWTREVVKMKGASFAAQDEELHRIFEHYRPRRLCMDQTGMGEKMVEDAKRRYGEYVVEGLLFTPMVKQDLAYAMKRKFEDRELRLPVDQEIRRAHHAVKKTTTVAGNVRFDAERTEAGHADEFWAHALAVHASGDALIEPAVAGADPDFDTYRSGRAGGFRAMWGRLH